MKQKSILLAGAMTVAGGVVIAAAATGQASAADRGRPVSAPASYTTVALGSTLSESDLVAPLGEWGVGRRTPRA
ncbi:hypothetical protein OKJ48_31845 [Streptomyces kunmingensis]|uniref:Uncharacterized protein n=1 Tax=Streptomyces kunmingensis TaxID=68225 RepID=A0ABU6CJC9_9ACTN|nr:hypothetical protein [Streptomyces kunmingensis]MEB3964788.1 hypothetical protein [Streptomyces kunmingensis]